MKEHQTDKVAAIYDLREAAEAKARAEVAVEAEPASRSAKDELLEAQLVVEAKTRDAIDVCHECGHAHPPQQPHERTPAPERRDGVVRNGNVHDVDFRRDTRGAS